MSRSSWSSIPQVTDCKHLCACGRIRRSTAKYSSDWCNRAHLHLDFFANPRSELSHNSAIWYLISDKLKALKWRKSVQNWLRGKMIVFETQVWRRSWGAGYTQKIFSLLYPPRLSGFRLINVVKNKNPSSVFSYWKPFWNGFNNLTGALFFHGRRQ